MKTLRCIIADDEPIARKILESYLQEVQSLELVASCKNAFEVMECLQVEPIDLLFLDINMPKLSGISLLKTLQQKPQVIITTAYPEYAVEGFELSVTDYLLKPFSLERFIQAVFKVQQKVSPQSQPISVPHETVDNFIFVKSDKKIMKIDFDTISHIEAYGNYIKIFAETRVLTPQTLSDFLQKLPDQFIRIHKSCIINFSWLKLIDGNQIVLQNDVKLPIGKSYKKAVLDRI
ncbi:MAG: LytTR family DNA-binding domain-containing protein [Bacteroidota bacterium]